MARKLILDVDTGTDDAVAVMLAALHPALELIGCTTVNGNIPVQYCTDNTLRVLEHIGRGDIPVFEGLARPIVRSSTSTATPPAAPYVIGQYELRPMPQPPSTNLTPRQKSLSSPVQRRNCSSWSGSSSA